jgi:beta-glucosidase/6-phospho-beta-glucosidase/beta-galactosidase
MLFALPLKNELNKMKKLIALLFAVAGLWVTGCQKDSSGLTPTDETAADFESVVASAARYAVTTDSVTVGKCKGKLTEVATADLAAAVTTYITTTYPGSEIKFAAKDSEGKVVVALVLADGSVKGLLFNADGTFKEELKQREHKAKLTKIEVSALPSAVTDYITANYAGSEVKQAGTNSDGEFFVGIVVDSKVKILLFNADGTFSKELEKPAMPHGRPGKH